MKQRWKQILFMSLLVLGALGLSVFIVACGGPSSSNTVVYPKPAIASLSPSSLPTGSASGSLTINGSGFLTSSTVTFNRVAQAATYVNASQLTIPLTAADLAMAGSYPIIVTNPAPGGGASAVVNFDVISNNPVPAISKTSPSFLVVGATPQTLSINGTGFLATSTVTFNGVAHAATYVNASQLTIPLTAVDLATAGNYPIIVTNPPPGGGTSAHVSFGIWGTFTDPTSHITISFPQLGSTTQPVSTFPPIGGISSFDINGWSAIQQETVPVVAVSLIPNPLALTLQQWFEENVDINGLLQAAATYQTEQFSNGVTALSLANPIPAEYLTVGSPTEEVYALSPDGKYVIAMTEAQQAQLSEYGYDSLTLFGQVLNQMTFN